MEKMKKAWRERVAVAQKRRRFIQADKEAWYSPVTCCVGEYAMPVAEALGLNFSEAWSLVNSRLDFSNKARMAIWANKPKALSKVLDQIEDHALEIKRTHVVVTTK